MRLCEIECVYKRMCGYAKSRKTTTVFRQFDFQCLIIAYTHHFRFTLRKHYRTTHK